MSNNSSKLLCQLVSPQSIEEIDHWVNKYPDNHKSSAVLAALRIVQEECGYLTEELMDAVAFYLEMPLISVYEVATFYTMYEREPTGKNIINVCTNISCMLAGSPQTLQYLEDKLKIRCKETTQDMKFTLRSVECLGACVNAPVIQINKDYYENLTPSKIDDILEKY